MDTASEHGISARAAAQRLGTTVPRVTRAVGRLGMEVERGPAGRIWLSPRQVEGLREHLGVGAHVPGLTRSEARVLAALARAPLGVGSARAAAKRAGTSPTATGRALKSLEQKGLVVRESAVIAAGRAREIERIRANVAAPEYGELARQLRRITPPEGRRRGKRDARVPQRLRHLFWNTAPSQLDVERAGGYIARRLITTGDLDGLAWGAENLTADDWRHAERTRGLSSERRALARNLAGQGRR